nr:hypothetical protein GCM10020063_071770 [Dactylosporangium thailandense]
MRTATCSRATRDPSNSISADGEFGPQTKSALPAAQRIAGTTADGVRGPGTRRAIVWDDGFGTCGHRSP